MPVGSYLQRLVFALRFRDPNILLSHYLTPESRILFDRTVRERAAKLAPFLDYDSDPYIVVASDGSLHWVIDAYTTSSRFPYAQPSGRNLNYIRNSVKVLIDAYHGSVHFYVVDAEDPLVQVYSKMFPDLFTPLEEAPDWAKRHFRYPVELFEVQAEIYQAYHMTDTTVFYNNEDLWSVPYEIVFGSEQPVEPYYVILQLPGEEQEEFLLIQPFAPANKNNMVAWLAGRSDGEHYGRLIAYHFPKQELVYGPMQIEARIDQVPDISAQLSLWSQRGSQVIRGNLLVIPLGNTFLYVEPIYLQADRGRIPELQRVVVASGDRIVMAQTLEQGLAELVGATPAALADGSPLSGVLEASLKEEVREATITANLHYLAAQEALKEGDWVTYGEEMKALEEALNRLLELVEAEEGAILEGN